jgi:hypothetical protein
VSHSAVISELRAIAERSAEASEHGGPEAELLDAYASLRERTVALARTYHLASEEQLADQFPSPQALREIETLDIAFGRGSIPGPSPDRGTTTRLTEALVELSGWARGARLAYETLEDDSR